MNEKGFTIIEIVTVIGLLAILAIIAVPNFIDLRDDARDAVTKDRMQSLKRAIVGDGRVVAGGVHAFPGFYGDLGRLPSALSELVTQGAMSTYNPITRIGWRGPYVDSSNLTSYSSDAWGTAFVYSSASRYIRSWGPNKADNSGATDDIQLAF